MEFRIADTFIDSLVKLPDQEQKAVKATAFKTTAFERGKGTGYIGRSPAICYWDSLTLAVTL